MKRREFLTLIAALPAVLSRSASAADAGLTESTAVSLTSGPIRSIAFSPDERTVAFGAQDDVLRVWSIGDSEARQKADGGALASYIRRHARDPFCLLSVGEQGAVSLYNAQTLDRDEWITQRAALAAISGNGHVLATAETDVAAPIRLWRLDATVPADAITTLPSLQGIGGTLNSLALSTDGSTVILGGALAGASDGHPPEGFVIIWARKDSDLPKLERAMTSIQQVTVSPDGNYLAAVGYEGDGSHADGMGQFWQIETRQRIGELPQSQGASINCAAFIPHRSLLATGATDQSVHLWDVPSGLMRANVRKLGAPISALAPSPSGKLLAVGLENGTLKILSIAV